MISTDIKGEHKCTGEKPEKVTNYDSIYKWSNPLYSKPWHDIGTLRIGPTIVDSAAAAQREVDCLLDRVHRNAIKFDAEKSEVIQFQGRSQKGFVNINIDGAEITPTEHIRWLGIYLDSHLSFKYHVEKWCWKAIKVAQHLRRLKPVRRGAAPSPLVTAANACVLLQIN